jgi:chemotaxis protein CheD
MRTTIAQGEFAVTSDPSAIYTAILGSCVAVCAFDSGRGVGGMNHILLPGDGKQDAFDESRRFGAYLMELLLNELYAKGARRCHLQFKLFGGSKIFDARFNPGELNIRFATDFVRNEGFQVSASSLGGSVGRRVEFLPTTGKVRMRFLGEAQKFPELAPVAQKPKTVPASSGELDLF